MTSKADRQRAWFEQMMRAAAVRGVAIYARGAAPFTAAQCEGRGDRTAIEHHNDAWTIEQIGAPVRPRFVPASSGTVAPPAHRVAADASSAVLDARLADIEQIGASAIFAITPRRSAPIHAVLDVEPAAVHPAATMRLDAAATRAPRSTLTDRIEDYSTAHRIEIAAVPLLGVFGEVPYRTATYGAPLRPRVLVPAAAAAASAADPGAFLRSIESIERDAETWMIEHGVEGYDWHERIEHGTPRRVALWPRPDRYERKHSRWHARADRVAHRGAARFVRPSAASSERVISDRTERSGAVWQCRTDVAWHASCQCGAAHRARRIRVALRYMLRLPMLDPRRVAFTAAHPIGKVSAALIERIEQDDSGRVALRAGVRRSVARIERQCQCERVRFIGHTAHRRTTVRTAAAVNAAQRASSGAARRGKAAGPWSLAASSLPRRVASSGAVIEADAIEQVLRTAALGAVLSFGTLRVTVLDGAQCSIERHSDSGKRIEHTYPIRELARRAAIAGIEHSDIG